MNPILKKLYAEYTADAGSNALPFGKWVVMETNKMTQQTAYGWNQLIKYQS